MAFLLELVPIITEAVSVGSEAVVAGGEIAAVDGEVGATTTEDTWTTIAEAGGTAREKATAAGEAGGTASSTISKAAVFNTTASGATAGAQVAQQAIEQGAIAFAKWAATESAKQALFYAGMKGAEAAFHTFIDGLKTPTPEVQAMSAKLTKINDAASRLHSTTINWLSWSNAHYADRASFGSVKVIFVDIMKFDTFQCNLGLLTDGLSTEIAPLLLAFNKSKTANDLEALRTAMLGYCNKVKGQSDSIKANEQTMVGSGLLDHQTDILSAWSDLH